MTDPRITTGLLTAEEVATRLGVSTETVRRLARAKKIPCRMIGRVMRFDWQQVLDHTEEPRT